MYVSSPSFTIFLKSSHSHSFVPSHQQVVAFDEPTLTLNAKQSATLSDAAVAMAADNNIIHLVIGPGLKNFQSKLHSLSPSSEFQHDLKVSASQLQSAVAKSQQSNILVIASDEGHVVVLNLPSYKLIFSHRLHTQGITDLSITADGKLAATTSRDRTAYIWHTHNGQILQTITPAMPISFKTHVRAIRFCPVHSNLIFTAESNPRRGGWIAVWRTSTSPQTSTYAPIASIKASSDALTAFAINSQGSLVAVSSSEGHVALFRWNGSSFSLEWTTESSTHYFKSATPPHVLPVTGICFSSSGRYMFTASADYTLAVWPTRRPTNWPRIFRIFFCFVTLCISMLAFLIPEDRHLLPAYRHRREVIVPYLEPHVSRLQSTLRPYLKRHHERIRPYIIDLKLAFVPHAKFISQQAEPYMNVGRRYSKKLQPMVERRYNRILGVARGTTAKCTGLVRNVVSKVHKKKTVVKSKRNARGKERLLLEQDIEALNTKEKKDAEKEDIPVEHNIKTGIIAKSNIGDLDAPLEPEVMTASLSKDSTHGDMLLEHDHVEDGKSRVVEEEAPLLTKDNSVFEEGGIAKEGELRDSDGVSMNNENIADTISKGEEENRELGIGGIKGDVQLEPDVATRKAKDTGDATEDMSSERCVNDETNAESTVEEQDVPLESEEVTERPTKGSKNVDMSLETNHLNAEAINVVDEGVPLETKDGYAFEEGVTAKEGVSLDQDMLSVKDEENTRTISKGEEEELEPNISNTEGDIRRGPDVRTGKREEFDVSTEDISSDNYVKADVITETNVEDADFTLEPEVVAERINRGSAQEIKEVEIENMTFEKGDMAEEGRSQDPVEASASGNIQLETEVQATLEAESSRTRIADYMHSSVGTDVGIEGKKFSTCEKASRPTFIYSVNKKCMVSGEVKGIGA